ncbi:MAG: signal recognition particle-docking protein FtsY [Campylobacterales bacterium]|nr:signal recognition particle-docking protein FtsY [Campylobacterales bacterium]
MLAWLSKTVSAIQGVAPKKQSTLTKEQLEEVLLEADVEYDLVEIILRELHGDKIRREQVRSKLLVTLSWAAYESPGEVSPFVDLIVGVNGAGKTTTISKLAKRSLNEGKKVLLGAADTFRAAAIEQLGLWAKRLEIPIIASKQGHDPSAVAYDAIESAKARGIDHVIIDTAGRLHTQKNLASELQKIVRICDKAHAGAPHRKMLIIDGTQGNSAIAQARAFHEMIDIDGIIITKLDGTAKGGAVFSIAYALRLPILFVGVGEQPEDLIVFDKYAFVDGFLDAIFEPDHGASATFASPNKTEAATAASAPEPSAHPTPATAPSGPTLEQISRLHAIEGADRTRLVGLLDADGYSLLSRHFVRNKNTWDDYKLVANEEALCWEIRARDGSVLRSYPLEA